MERKSDQAENLRVQVKVQEERALPPRSDIHRQRKSKKKKLNIQYPIVKLLMLLFFVVVFLAFTYPYWINKL